MRPELASGRTASRGLTIAFFGAILAGGRSSRMGTDKASLDPYGDGPMAAAVAGALREAGAIDVVLIGARPSTADVLGLRTIPDDHPDTGPLGGILTAFSASTEDLVAVVACDMPFLDGSVLESLMAGAIAHPEADALLCISDGRLQPLTAVWRRSRCQPVLQRAFDDGQRAPRRLLHLLDARGVDVLDPSRLVDIDSPADIDRYAHLHPIGATEGRDVAELPEIDVQTLAGILDDVFLLDVREPDEYLEAHVPGAVPMPLATVPDSIGILPQDEVIHVICAAGGRSARAAEFLISQGLDAVNIAGGTNAWIQRGEAVVTGSEPF